MPRSSDELQLFKGKGCRKGESVHQVVLAVIGPLCGLLIFLVAYTVLIRFIRHIFFPVSDLQAKSK